MYVYMFECVYVFMYLYVCNPMREREIEREGERGREIERGGDKFMEGNLIALKNAVICLHDPIILYLAHGF